MGSIASAACDCGYAADVPLGGGMMNHETVCAFPVGCRGCGSLQVVNLLDAPVACEACGGRDLVPYDAPELAGEPGSNDVFAWALAPSLGRIPRLTDGTYRCPACKETRLRFRNTGSWD